MVMKKVSCVDSPLRQSAGKSSDLPEKMAAATDFFLAIFRYISLYLGFSRREGFIGEGGDSEAVQGTQTLARRGLGFDPRLGWVWLPCGPPPAHLRPSGVFYYKTTLNNFLCRFREYFLCNFSGIKNSRKQELALWHLVNMLVTGKSIKTPRSTNKTYSNWQ